MAIINTKKRDRLVTRVLSYQQRVLLAGEEKLAFATGDFSRATEGSYRTNVAGSEVAWAAPNERRFEPTADFGELLLIERASTNLLSNPTDIEAWALASQITPVSNARTAPDGTMTAGLVDFQGTAPAAQLRDNVTMADNTAYTGSLWVRGDTPARLTGRYRLIFKDGTDAEFEPVTPGSYDMPADWTRISASGDSGTGATQPLHLLSQGASPSTEDYVVWGNQVEALPFASSYIRNGLERDKDYWSIPAADVPPWLREGAFKLVIIPNYSSEQFAADGNIRCIYGGGAATTNAIFFQMNPTLPSLVVRSATNSVVLRLDDLRWSAYQPIVMYVDHENRKLALFGAGSPDASPGIGTYDGNNVWTWTNDTAWPVADVSVGANLGNQQQFDGLVGEPTRITGGVSAALAAQKSELGAFSVGTFTRGQEGSLEDPDGTVSWYGANIPRVDSEGLWLFEGPSTNLLAVEDTTDLTGWTEVFSTDQPTREANAGVAPDGTNTASRIAFAGGDLTSRAQLGVADFTIADGSPFAYSAYYRGRLAAGQRFEHRMNLKDGTTVDANVTRTAGLTWQRFASATGNIGGPGTAYQVRVQSDEVASDLLYWGAQAEARPFPTSYIRNGLERPADRLTLTQAQAEALYGSGRFQFDCRTLFGTTSVNTAARQLLNFSGGGASDGLYWFENTGRLRLAVGNSVLITLSGLAHAAGLKSTISVDMNTGVLGVDVPDAGLTVWGSFTPGKWDFSGTNVVGSNAAGSSPAWCRISPPRSW